MTSRAPAALAGDLRRARHLAWWTIAWMLSIIVVVGATAGSSQAMKTAWLEDVLSLVPAIVFLIALRQEARSPMARFPYGFLRVNGVAFMISAVALAAMGGFLLLESVIALVRREHVTILPMQVFGHTVWSGWVMIAALMYSLVPPMILGRRKLPLARRLQDKVLHTDALMQKADWMTGGAGAAGVLGVGLGWWWADAVAAGVISFSILSDGINAVRTASAELIDGAPRSLDGDDLAEDALRLREAIQEHYPGATVRIRETGRFIRAEVAGVVPPASIDLDRLWPGRPERRWRLAEVSFVPREPDDGSRDASAAGQAPSPAAGSLDARGRRS